MQIKFACVLAIAVLSARAAEPDVTTIIQKSVEANRRDFEAAPHFENKELSKKPGSTKTYLDLMIEGTPYRRLIAVNGQPLSADQQKAEQEKEERERQKRKSESQDERKSRIAKYDRERRRDNEMMDQLTQAFDFKLTGKQRLRGFNVYVLKATPKPGYKPINMSSQVLPGMAGQLWIDQATYQWVKVMAQVIHPVSIEGFLAQVEPGTRFEVEKAPVGDGKVWQFSHFAVNSNAKVLFMFNHDSQEDDTYWDYRPTK